MDKIYEEKRDQKSLIALIIVLPFLIFGIIGMAYLIKISYTHFINFKLNDWLGYIFVIIAFLMITAFTWFMLSICLNMAFNRTSLFYDKLQSKIIIHDFFFNLSLWPHRITYRFDLSLIQKIIRYKDINTITLTHSFFVLGPDCIAGFPTILYTHISELKDFEIETVKSTEISVREFGKKYNLKDKWWRGGKCESMNYVGN